jgi:multiple sugar transport system substrate-binding protein
MRRSFWLLFLIVLLAMPAALPACAQAPAPAPAEKEAAAPAEAEPAKAEPAKAEEGKAATGEVVEIKWLEWWQTVWLENQKQLIADFEATHPNIKVTIVDTPWNGMPEKLQAAAAGGGETYDVLGMEGEWIASLNKQGYLENLDPWLEKEPEFADGLLAATPMKLFGETRAFCLYLIPYQFAYNIRVFEEKGLKPPTNWDEFVKVLEALRDKSTNTYGMSMPLQDGSFIMTRYFPLRLAQEGGQWFDENGKVAFNSPEGVAALQWWVDFYKKDLVVPGSMGENQSGMQEFLASEQTSATIDGPFIPETIRAINPDVKMAYAPPWKDKTGGYSWACSGIAMPATSAHKEEAWEFIKYLYSEKVSTEFAKKIAYVWATKAGLSWLEDSDDPFLKWAPAMANQDPEHNVVYPILPEGEKLTDAFKLAFQEALSGEKDAKTALDEAAAVWQETLDAAK